jgi:hypothetical protein
MSLLKLLNCNVAGVEDGLAAVHLFRPEYVHVEHGEKPTEVYPPRPVSKEPFDIVFMDGNMPLAG